MNIQAQALKIVEQLPLIKDDYECINDNVYALRYQRQKLENDLNVLNKQKASSMNEFESLHEDIDKLKYERHELSSLIAQLKNDSDEYSKLKRIVEEKVRKILGTSSYIVGISLLAVLMAIQDDRNNPLLTDLLEGRVDTARIFASPENNYYRQKLSEFAKIYYEKLISDCMKSSWDSITFGFEGQHRQLP
jgi:DNA repair exonuclease SbcCD ATPase subunit